MDRDNTKCGTSRINKPPVRLRAGTRPQCLPPPINSASRQGCMDTPEDPGETACESSTRKRPRNRLRSEPVYAAVGMQYLPTSPLSLGSPPMCTKCGAKKFAFETVNFCCQDGQVHLSSNDFPHALLDLFRGNSDLANHFQLYSRVYNNFFAFSSLGGQLDVSTTKGIHVFSLQGQLYHYLPNLLPQASDPNYLQMYFYDGALENDVRMARFANLNSEVVSILMTVMDLNPYAHFFHSLRNIDIVADSKVIISCNPVLDQRVYNAPTSDQVAAILVDGTNSPEINSPHVLVVGKSERSHRVMHYYGCYDPLQYPLLFPRGDCGWHQGIPKQPKTGCTLQQNIGFPVVSTLVQDEEDLLRQEYEVTLGAHNRPSKVAKEVSCREYYAYRFQYIVDMYVKVENTRLDFFRRHQATIRSELYQGVVDSFNKGHRSAAEIGKRIILPASFIGGPRDMKRRYLNAMTIVQKCGKPDLFITMTCNPRWPEIQAELKPGEKPENRPELCARIFHAKLTLLKSQIVDKHIFGPVAARVHVIEFQNRGLPHAHLLIILLGPHKILGADAFDKYVCAEIPGEDRPILRQLVKQHMMHGPCGDLNTNCACMKQDGYKRTCKFRYPKRFSNFTTCVEDSYPTYMRRDNGQSLRVRDVTLDNRWVIPYNPYLLAAFDCHINVEVCSTVKAVKYLYKYVYKGHDRVSFHIAENNAAQQDEIENYQSGRWNSPPEAAWRIFGFDLFDMSPAVVPLQVHLPNLQSVTFIEYESLRSISNDEGRQKTMLTEFFATNQIFPDYKYLYCEFPEYFVWDQKYKTWRQRKVRTALGRVAYVNPMEGERYYLRWLLSNVRGPLSFIDLMTVNGQRCDTYKEAAMMLDLLERDGYVESCMDEAIVFAMPHTLRRLFATLLIFCAAPNPRAL